MESEVVEPSVNLLESMRSVGYSLEAAIADLLDNSITAGATEIAIDADVVDGNYLAILDDGRGMTPAIAREALRFAGATGTREATDLGRFGLGLKTASLSQARCLTVVTKQNNQVTALRWDIDFVRSSAQWLLNVLEEEEVHSLPLWEALDARPTGTLVLWNQLDLLLGDSKDPGAYLAERLKGVRASVSLVFHRFLQSNRTPLNITINGLRVNPTDPFLSTNPKTQRTSPEALQIDGVDVLVEAFTLPHVSGLSPAERRRPDLGEGMRDAQGFYLYRNSRLISYGHWYGLARMSELSKQTRIKVDVPSSLDALWQLDIKKSRAHPPPSFKARLRQLIEPILDKGHRVHTYRGRRETTDIAHIWTKLKTRDGFGYEVNLDSPVIAATLAHLDPDGAKRVIELLRTVADAFPITDAYVEVAANRPAIVQSQDRSGLLNRLREIHDSGLLDQNPDVAWTQLLAVEPFNAVPDLKLLVNLAWKSTHATE